MTYNKSLRLQDNIVDFDPASDTAGRAETNGNGKKSKARKPAGNGKPPAGFALRDDGVWYTKPEKKQENERPIRISGRCYVTGWTRANEEAEEEDWGVVVEWVNKDGKTKQRPFPQRGFHDGGSSKVVQDLATSGLEVVVGCENHVLRYLGNFQTDNRQRCVRQVGWIEGDQMRFVMPESTIGGSPESEPIVFQPERYSPTTATMKSAGTLQEWNENVLAIAANHPWLLFALSFALVGPLLKFASVMDSFGIHIYDPSSHGKTTSAQVTASVWGCGADPNKEGGRAYTRRWNNTANALGGLCAAHNDCLLILDEIGACAARDMANVVMNLFTATDKGRMDQNVNLRRSQNWRVPVYSTGEISISQKIHDSGSEVHAGQLVRFLDIRADGGLLVGDTQEERQRTADTLKANCSKYYGTAGPAFLKALTEQYEGQANALADAIDVLIKGKYDTLAELLPQNTPPEYARVIKRFALIDVAGSLAVDLLEWTISKDDISAAVRTVCKAWLNSSGPLTDNQRGVEAIRDFISKHGESRFMRIKAGVRNDNRQQIINLAGYYDEDFELWLFTDGGFKEACSKLEAKGVVKELDKQKLLFQNNGKHLKAAKVIDGKRMEFFAVKNSILLTLGSEV